MSSGQPIAARAGGAPQRRRARRFRSFLRHERMTVRMALAEALHHSCGVEPSGPNEALRGQKTASAAGTQPEPLEVVSAPTGTEDPASGDAAGASVRGGRPAGSAVTVGYVAAPESLLSTPLLADTAAETVDARTVKSLQKSLAWKKEGEARGEDEAAQRQGQPRPAAH